MRSLRFRIVLACLALVLVDRSWAPPPNLASLYGLPSAQSAAEVEAVAGIALTGLISQRRLSGDLHSNRDDMQRVLDLAKMFLDVQSRGLGPSAKKLAQLARELNILAFVGEAAHEFSGDGHNDHLEEISFTKKQKDALLESSWELLARASRSAKTRAEYLTVLLQPFTPRDRQMVVPYANFQAMMVENGQLLRPELFPNGGMAELMAEFYKGLLAQEQEKNQKTTRSDVALRDAETARTARIDFARIVGDHFGPVGDVRSKARGTEAAKLLEEVRTKLDDDIKRFASPRDAERRQITADLLYDVARGGITPAVRIYRICRQKLWEFGGI